MEKNESLTLTEDYTDGTNPWRRTQYLFIEGMTVVGTVEADCAACAWREGSHKWPHALMAIWCGDVDRSDPCSNKTPRPSRRPGEYRYHEPETLLERISSYHRDN